jgi:FkbM family methyltransferase
MTSLLLDAVKHVGERFGVGISRYPRRTSFEGDLASLLTTVDVAVDVGARHGEYGRLLRKLKFRGPIVSFEPSTDSYDRLSQVTARDSRWTAHRLALGAQAGETTLSVFEGSYLNSLLPINSYGRGLFGDNARSLGQEQVTVARLDDVRPSLVLDGIADAGILLKIDTQGYDLEVLAGASETLTNVRVLQIELSVKRLYERQVPLPDALRHIGGLGFDLVGLHPVAHDSDGLRLVDCDALFLRDGPPSTGSASSGSSR